MIVLASFVGIFPNQYEKDGSFCMLGLYRAVNQG